jgi:hypothetical protein
MLKRATAAGWSGAVEGKYSSGISVFFTLYYKTVTYRLGRAFNETDRTHCAKRSRGKIVEIEITVNNLMRSSL